MDLTLNLESKLTTSCADIAASFGTLIGNVQSEYNSAADNNLSFIVFIPNVSAKYLDKLPSLADQFCNLHKQDCIAVELGNLGYFLGPRPYDSFNPALFRHFRKMPLHLVGGFERKAHK